MTKEERTKQVEHQKRIILVIVSVLAIVGVVLLLGTIGREDYMTAMCVNYSNTQDIVIGCILCVPLIVCVVKGVVDGEK